MDQSGHFNASEIEEKAKCKKTKYPTLPKLNSLGMKAELPTFFI